MMLISQPRPAHGALVAKRAGWRWILDRSLEDDSVRAATEAAERWASEHGAPAIVCQAELLDGDGGQMLLRALSASVPPDPRVVLKAADEALLYHLAKATPLNPLNPKHFDRMVAALSAKMHAGAGHIRTKAMRDWMHGMDFDWRGAPEQSIRQATHAVNSAMRKAGSLSWQTNRGTIETSHIDTANKSARRTMQQHKLSVGSMLEGKDREVLRRSSAAQAHYIRDYHTGAIAPALSQRVREIAEAGLDKGLPSAAIARQMRREVGSQLSGWQRNYFDIVASAVVGRSRSYGQLRSMQNAGVTRYIISAVLDEATTERCRFLDGKVFSVEHGLQRYAETDALADPRDVNYSMPWLKESKIQGGRDAGKVGIYVPSKQGDKLAAVVERPGFGTKDQKGTYSRTMGSQQLMDSNVGTPPYHAGCRTVIVPDVVAPTTTRRPTPPPAPPARRSPFIPLLASGKPNLTPAHTSRAIDAATDAELDWLEQNGVAPTKRGKKLVKSSDPAIKPLQQAYGAANVELLGQVAAIRVGAGKARYDSKQGVLHLDSKKVDRLGMPYVAQSLAGAMAVEKQMKAAKAAGKKVSAAEARRVFDDATVADPGLYALDQLGIGEAG
jgi:SPP1 gp7 family putative phage head morphogenesis protein